VGWQYTLAYPAKYWRLRLACTWPIWIGLRTLALLREANPLDPTQRVMVPQGEVNWMLARSLVTCRSDRLLDAYYRKLRAGTGRG
jgi:farnesyl-diphosphate farnesyltransferase